MGTYYDAAGRQYADIKLTWDANTELDVNPNGRYVVQWSRDGVDWQSTEVPGDTTSCRVSGLATGVDYYFRVRAEDKAGNASANWTNFNSGNAITMSQDADPPTDTSNTLSYNSLRRAIQILWTKPSDPDYEYAEVCRNSTGAWNGSETKVGEGTDRVTDEVGVLVASFYYGIKLYDDSGNYMTGTTWILANTDTTNPDPPTNLAVSDGTLVDAAGHVITWLEVSFNYPSPVGDVTGFEVQVWYDLDDDGSYADEDPDTWTVKVQSGDSSGTIKRLGVPGNVDYRIRVRSEDDAGLKSTWTGYQTGTTAKDTVGPGDPTNYSVTAGKKKLILEFDKPADDDWAAVEIHADTSGSTFTPSSANLVADVRATRHEWETSYGTWYVKIRLRDTSGNYNPSGYVYAGSAVPTQQSSSDLAAGSVGDTQVGTRGLSSSSILISGSVGLDGWRWPTDPTKMDFGSMANVSIATADIQDLSVTVAKIQDATITGAKIASATITAANIVDATITGAKIANATITNAHITALSADKIEAGTISASVSIQSAGTIGFSDGPTLSGSSGWLQCSNSIQTPNNIYVGGAIRCDSYYDHNGQTQILSGTTLQNATVASSCTGGGGLNAGQCDGYDVAEAATASTIVARDSSGDISVVDVNKTGSCSAVEETSRGRVRMVSIESPEVWYFDFAAGEQSGELVRVPLDALFDEVTAGDFYLVPMFAARRDGQGLVASLSQAERFMILAKRRGYSRIRFERLEGEQNGADDNPCRCETGAVLPQTSGGRRAGRQDLR